MRFIEVKYSSELKPLEEALAEVWHPGSFYARGVTDVPLPRVHDRLGRQSGGGLVDLTGRLGRPG